MADRLVNRQPEVRRIENQVVLAGLDAPGRDLLGGERRPAARVARHVERLDVLPALRRAARARARTPGTRRRRRWRSPRTSGPTRISVCVTLVPSVVTSVLTSRRSASDGAGEADGRHLQRRFVGGEEQRDLLLERHLERIAADRRHPGAGHRLDGRQLDAVLAHDARGPRHGGRIGCRALRARARHRARGGEAPAAVDERADAEAVRLAVADAGDLALARRDRLAAVAADPRVGVRRARLPRRVQRFVGDLERRGIRCREQPACANDSSGSGPYAATAAALAAVVLMKSRRVGDMPAPATLSARAGSPGTARG